MIQQNFWETPHTQQKTETYHSTNSFYSKLLHGTVPKSKAEMSSSSFPGDSCPSAMASKALLRTAAWTCAASMELKGGAVGGVLTSKWVWGIPWWRMRMKITKSKNGDFRFRRIESVWDVWQVECHNWCQGDVKLNPRVGSVALAKTWISGAETATLPKRNQQQNMWWCQLLHEVKNYGFSLHMAHIIFCSSRNSSHKVYLQTSMALPFQSPLPPCLSQKSQLFSCSSCTKMVLEFKRQVDMILYIVEVTHHWYAPRSFFYFH